MAAIYRALVASAVATEKNDLQFLDSRYHIMSQMFHIFAIACHYDISFCFLLKTSQAIIEKLLAALVFPEPASGLAEQCISYNCF
jgi:hypothetical protein